MSKGHLNHIDSGTITKSMKQTTIIVKIGNWSNATIKRSEDEIMRIALTTVPKHSGSGRRSIPCCYSKELKEVDEERR